MDLQAMFDGMSIQWQRERSEKMMTLGKLIELTGQWDPTRIVRIEFEFDSPEKIYPEGLISYRGYYCDLSIDYSDKPVTVGDFNGLLKDAMGRVFTGYKGGDFMMGETTPIWVSEYGCCENRVITEVVVLDGEVVLKTKVEDL